MLFNNPRLATLWHRLGRWLFGDDPVTQEEITDWKNKAAALIDKVYFLENDLASAREHITKQRETITANADLAKELATLQKGYEQDALAFLQFRKLAVNFVSAYNQSFMRRRAAVSMMVRFLEDRLGISPEEIKTVEQHTNVDEALMAMKKFLQQLRINTDVESTEH